MIKKIVIAYDGSDPSKKALDYAISLVEKYSAQLTVLSIVRIPEVPDDVETEAIIDEATDSCRREFEQMKSAFTEKNIAASFEVRVGHPADQIVSFADEIKADLIVMGHRGRTEVSRWLLGSISKRVMSYAHCSVFLVR
jgi:nucleotide-binding universal stress UspA family protein